MTSSLIPFSLAETSRYSHRQGNAGAFAVKTRKDRCFPPAAARQANFRITLTIDLSTGNGSGSWTLPDGTAQSPTFDIQWVKTVSRPEGTMLLFAGETSSDDAAYSLALLLI